MQISHSVDSASFAAIAARSYTPSRALAKQPLDGDLRADLDHPFGGNLEIVGGVVGRPAEANEQMVLPQRHAGLCGRLERPSRHEERRRHDVELPALLAVSYTHLTLPTIYSV